MPGDDSPSLPPADIERSPARLKRRLRAEAVVRRSALADADRAAAGQAMAGHGLALARRLAARTVAAYVGVGTEPPTLPMLDALRADGRTVLVPIVEGHALRWSVYDGEPSLATTVLGLREPSHEHAGEASLADAHLVFAPALLVDRAGHRLGRGGGFYDRALPAVDVPVFAVVYDDEVVDSLPAEPHDVAVSGAVTPGGSVSFGPC